MTPLPNPFFDSAAGTFPADAAVVANSPVATTVDIPESAAPLPAQVERADTAGAVGPPPAPAAFNLVLDDVLVEPASSETAAATVGRSDINAAAEIFSVDDTKYIPELFLDYARRRSMAIISPPIAKADRNIDSIALKAVEAALNIHPRDLDLDPPPLFLRKPRPAFLRALLQLGGTP